MSWNGWHRLSPFELDGRWLIGVGRTPEAGIGYNRIELTLSGGLIIVGLAGIYTQQRSCDRFGPNGYVTQDVSSRDGARRGIG